jgi:hypothetical protein
MYPSWCTLMPSLFLDTDMAIWISDVVALDDNFEVFLQFTFEPESMSVAWAGEKHVIYMDSEIKLIIWRVFGVRATISCRLNEVHHDVALVEGLVPFLW